MKVTTELTVSDVVAVNLRNYVSNRARYAMCAVIAFAYSAYLISDLGMPADQRAWFIYVAGGVLFAVAFFLLFLIVNVLNAVVIVRDTSGVVGPHDIEILPEGFRDVTPVTDSLTRWRGVHRITRRGDYLSFWISPYLAHVVPGRAFPDAETFADFERLARSYLGGDNAAPAPIPARAVAPRVVVQTDPKLWKRPA